ncbi:MAG: phosphohistidine phosphatase SixA [Desulfobacteraceae bacterium]|nr:phosphohistidine phosphatase SixA [Desulfobacteraceae bacterium]
MAIFLVQHGICHSKDQDPEKGLSEIGFENTSKIAQVAKAYKIPVLKIVQSGKKRAEQTATIFKEILDVKDPCERINGIKPLDNVKAFADGIDPNSNVMIVGHLPFMARLVSYLTAGSENLKVYKFQNSGIVCLDFEEGSWFIKWTLNPDIS